MERFDDDRASMPDQLVSREIRRRGGPTRRSIGTASGKSSRPDLPPFHEERRLARRRTGAVPENSVAKQAFSPGDQPVAARAGPYGASARGDDVSGVIQGRRRSNAGRVDLNWRDLNRRGRGAGARRDNRHAERQCDCGASEHWDLQWGGARRSRTVDGMVGMLLIENSAHYGQVVTVGSHAFSATTYPLKCLMRRNTMLLT